ncbi:MAG: DNA translocase FtsK, partial [Boseongicola sp.]|nr:DNA translocase FtsK [Boseongicola sp.]
MAYQARHRDPLFDSDTQAIIERRGKELLGMVLLGVAILMALMLGSYSPDDPNWLSATDSPARNLLGPLGAALASPLYVIAGYGAWAIAAVLAFWGLRFVVHFGEERALGRLIFAPIGVAFVSVFASTHVPGADWTHSFGLGGLFGDTVLGAILGVLPVSPGLGLKVLSLALAIGAVAMGAFVLGFNRDEIWAYVRYVGGGLILIYHGFLSLLGHGASTGLQMARDARRRAAERRELNEHLPEVEPGSVNDAVLRATRGFRDSAVTGQKPGLLQRMPSLLRKSEPDAGLAPHNETDRISARIADAVKSRVRRPEGLARAEPPVTAEDVRSPRITMLDEDGELAELRALDEQMTMPEPELVNTHIPQSSGFQSSRAATPESKAVVQHSARKSAPSKRARAEAQPS